MKSLILEPVDEYMQRKTGKGNRWQQEHDNFDVEQDLLRKRETIRRSYRRPPRRA